MLQMNLDQQGKLHIILEPELRLQICSEFSRVVNQQFGPMYDWFNNPKVPEQQKKPYMDTLTKALAEMNFLYQLLLKCGFTDKEIMEYASLPF